MSIFLIPVTFFWTQLESFHGLLPTFLRGSALRAGVWTIAPFQEKLCARNQKQEEEAHRKQNRLFTICNLAYLHGATPPLGWLSKKHDDRTKQRPALLPTSSTNSWQYFCRMRRLHYLYIWTGEFEDFHSEFRPMNTCSCLGIRACGQYFIIWSFFLIEEQRSWLNLTFLDSLDTFHTVREKSFSLSEKSHRISSGPLTYSTACNK